MHRPGSKEESQPMNRTVALMAALALMGFGYYSGRSRSESNLLHADEAAKWTKTEIRLTVNHDERFGLAYAQGFWQSTSPSKDKQLLSPIAVKIECNRHDKTCKESEASVLLGSILQADLLEYEITSWTGDSIVADDTDEGDCGIGHRLSLDFKDNSVTVTDYPKKVTSGKNCKAFQDANSYALHGGQLMLYPP